MPGKADRLKIGEGGARAHVFEARLLTGRVWLSGTVCKCRDVVYSSKGDVFYGD